MIKKQFLAVLYHAFLYVAQNTNLSLNIYFTYKYQLKIKAFLVFPPIAMHV